ncbi:MAG: choice-of-anchor Q domain-containing protein, partial [Chitinophagales bacterium]
MTGAFFGTSISFDSITLTNVNTSGADLFFAKLDITSFTHGQIFVKQNATGNNDGTSWKNAFTKFQDALDYADNGDQIWIAEGNYTPEGPSPDSSHFLSKKAVSIYGGFEGTESDLSQRNWQTFRTIINGDILGDDQDSTNRLDNAHHVLIINNGDGETTLDGLIFSGGRGALYILNTDVKIRNCTFWDNDGEYGSGLFARNSDSISNTLVIKNSTFEQNRGIGGAAIFLGVFNNARRLHYEIDSCTFKNNISYSAGTIYSTSDSISQHTSIIKNSEFLNNIGNYGGGAIFSVSENLIIENCNFEENYARLYPGCICPSGGIITFINPSSAHIAIRKTIFNNNDVYEFEDGVVNIFGGYAELDNVLFHDNYGYSSILSYGNTRLSNITMVDNQGGLIGYGNSTEIQNSIFDNEEVNLRYWEGADIISKGGNISSDSSMAPVLLGYNGYADLHQTDPLLDADFIPLSNSPCIDAGNSEGVVSLYDLAGNPRIQGHGIDAGAYESPFMVAVKDAVWDSQVLSVYPNPVLDVLNFELESDWI